MLAPSQSLFNLGTQHHLFSLLTSLVPGILGLQSSVVLLETSHLHFQLSCLSLFSACHLPLDFCFACLSFFLVSGSLLVRSLSLFEVALSKALLHTVHLQVSLFLSTRHSFFNRCEGGSWFSDQLLLQKLRRLKRARRRARTCMRSRVFRQAQLPGTARGRSFGR